MFPVIQQQACISRGLKGSNESCGLSYQEWQQIEKALQKE